MTSIRDKKDGFIILLIQFLVLIFLMSGCKAHSKSERDIIVDLQNESSFQRGMGVEITDYSIIKRQTDPDNKSDIVYINVDAENEQVKWNRSYVMTYGLYNEGWILDDVTDYEISGWKIWPTQGISDTMLNDYIASYKNEYSCETIEVTDRETSLDENVGTDEVNFKVVKEHLFGTETIEFKQIWVFDTNFCDFIILDSPQYLGRSIILNKNIVGIEWNDIPRNYEGVHVYDDHYDIRVDSLSNNGICLTFTRKGFKNSVVEWLGLRPRKHSGNCMQRFILLR